MALFRLGVLVAVLRANQPCMCKCWLSGGVQSKGSYWWRICSGLTPLILATDRNRRSQLDIADGRCVLHQRAKTQAKTLKSQSDKTVHNQSGYRPSSVVIALPSSSILPTPKPVISVILTAIFSLMANQGGKFNQPPFVFSRIYSKVKCTVFL